MFLCDVSSGRWVETLQPSAHLREGVHGALDGIALHARNRVERLGNGQSPIGQRLEHFGLLAHEQLVRRFARLRRIHHAIHRCLKGRLGKTRDLINQRPSTRRLLSQLCLPVRALRDDDPTKRTTTMKGEIKT